MRHPQALRFPSVSGRLAAVLFVLISPTAASADILEVGAGSYRWVAGGQVAAPGVPVTEILEDADRQASTSTHPSALTQAELLAGPERWSGRVGELAAKYDISPALLEALVWQESRWNAAAVSPVGAQGLAQLMPATARALGVDPSIPNANLEGGARYLRMQLDTFGGDIEKALAAYNAGPMRVQRSGGIPAIRETQLYVASIMARLAAPVRR